MVIDRNQFKFISIFVYFLKVILGTVFSYLVKFDEKFQVKIIGPVQSG